MFKQTAGNAVSSNLGCRCFAIQIIGKAWLKHSEGDKTLSTDIEMLVGKPSMAVYESSITKWEPPHDYELLSSDKRDEILKNISEALKFLKITFEID